MHARGNKRIFYLNHTNTKYIYICNYKHIFYLGHTKAKYVFSGLYLRRSTLNKISTFC